MLSVSDITMMQTELGLLRTTPCTIQRKTATPDHWGGATETWATIATTLCRVAPVKQTFTETDDEGRVVLVNRWTIALAEGTDITPPDRIVALGITYEVESVGPRTVDLERVAQCVRRQ